MPRPPRPDEKLELDQRWLKRLARRMARSPGSAEDLVQETYLTALSKPPPDGPMRPWLLGVMRKLAWREVRSGQRRAHREECFQHTAPSVAEPDPLLAYGVDRARLRSIVERLPEPFRSTVEQRFLEGLSCVEIARAAGVPAGTIRWRQSRALELLRAELERPPRRRARWGFLWLPLFGLERAAAVGQRLGLSSRGRGGLALLGVALVAALAALVRSDVPGDRGREGRRPGLSVQASGAAAALRLAGLRAANGATLASASPRRADGDELDDGQESSGDDSPSTSTSMSTVLEPEVAPDLLERELYDCTDEGGELSCVRQKVVTADQMGGPVCLILDRSLAALDRTRFRRSGTRSIDKTVFLRTARLANLVLAAELGCALALEPEPEEEREGGATGRTPEPSCRSQEDESGRSCTTCTDEHGVATTACAPVDCQTAARRDGSPCTTCTDADGRVESDCDPEPGGCAAIRDVEGFADEILPILSGQLELDEPEGEPIIGCTYGRCHGSPRPDGLYLDLGDTLENNLELFACFVDPGHPESSQILLCATNDERCAVYPHPGPELFTGPEDGNYQRLLAYIRANVTPD